MPPHPKPYFLDKLLSSAEVSKAACCLRVGTSQVS